MVALGPRVGGAHVDVNLKFDSSSMNSVARSIHRQLASIGDHNREVYRSIGKESVVAWRAALGATVAAAPLMGSLISSVAGAATTLAGSLYSVGQTSGALLPIFTSLGVAGLTLSIGMNNFMTAVGETNPKALAQMLESMPKSMQKAVMSTRKLSNEMRAAIWPKLFDGLSDGINKLRKTGVVQRGLGLMADQLNGLAKGLLNYANSKQGISTLNKFFENNAKVFGALSKAVVPFLDGFLRLVNALTPAAIRLSGRITDIAKRFQDWTKGEGFGKRIDSAMKGAEKTAGLLWKVLSNLGSAVMNIFNITNPSTNTFLQMLVDVTKQFKDFTNSAKGKSSIAEWAANSVEVMKQVGHTLKAVFKVIAELSDSRVIISFLKTVEGAFKHLGDLPLDKMVDKFTKLSEKLQPISSWLLAAIIAGASFNILLGSLMGQIGGFFSVLKNFKITGGDGIFAGIFGKKGVGKHVAEVGRLSNSLKGIGSILGKALKFAGIAGLAVYVTMLILKSDKLKGKVKEAFEAFKGLWEPLKNAFKEITTSLKPVNKGLQPVFKVLDWIASLAIGLVIDTITYAFKSLGKVIEGAGHIISGVIDFFVGLFTLDGSKMLDGLKKIASGILPLLEGLFGLFVTFFAPAKLLKIGAFAFKGLFTGIKGAFPSILRGVGSLLGKVLSGIVKLAPKLFSAGFKAIFSLGKSVIKGGPGVLLKMGKLYLGVVKWILKLPGKLFELGVRAITKLGSSVLKNTPKVLALAGKIFKGITEWIGKLPGKLFDLGKLAFTKLGTAIRNAIGKLKSAAGTIFKAIWNEIKSLPGQALKLGKSIIGGIVDGITDKLDDVKKIVGKVADTVGKFWPGSPVQEGPLKAWNYGSGATGGGRNVIEALAGGLEDTSPIRKAMAGVASAVSGSFAGPTVSGGKTTGRVPESTPGGNIYISKMSPHNYKEFERQMREKSRLAALGGRRPVVA